MRQSGRLGPSDMSPIQGILAGSLCRTGRSTNLSSPGCFSVGGQPRTRLSFKGQHPRFLPTPRLIPDLYIHVSLKTNTNLTGQDPVCLSSYALHDCAPPRTMGKNGFNRRQTRCHLFPSNGQTKMSYQRQGGKGGKRGKGAHFPWEERDQQLWYNLRRVMFRLSALSYHELKHFAKSKSSMM